MYGLDLFSGIGGLTKALEPWVRPVSYCENERYAVSVLFSRMSRGELPVAPVWDDVRTLRGRMLPRSVDIIYGGFPCQDISVAGRGAGLAGERSGLFFEIVRLAEEIKPTFLFLENVANIRSKGLNRVLTEIAGLGYDCRYGVLSASDVGAPHRRDRWWLLAYRNSGSGSAQLREQQEERPQAAYPSSERGVADTNSICDGGRTATSRHRLSSESPKLQQADGEACSDHASEVCPDVADSESEQGGRVQSAGLPADVGAGGEAKDVSDAGGVGLSESKPEPSEERTNRTSIGPCPSSNSWWSTEPNVGRVAHGIPFRVDRLRGLGNAVVPAQAREAFKRLIGFK